MPLLITVGIVMLATIIIVAIKARDIFDLDEGILYGFLVSILTGGLSLVFLVVISTIPESEEVLHNEIKISALKDNSNVSGSFFLKKTTEVR